MKVLYDENLPPSLINRLSDLFPDSEHVRNIGLASEDDSIIWDYALNNGYTIFSKDSDFQNLAILTGHPPKSIRIGVGNATVNEMEQFIRDRKIDIDNFMADPDEAHLELR